MNLKGYSEPKMNKLINWIHNILIYVIKQPNVIVESLKDFMIIKTVSKQVPRRGNIGKEGL